MIFGSMKFLTLEFPFLIRLQMPCPGCPIFDHCQSISSPVATPEISFFHNSDERVILPALTCLKYRGTSMYLNRFVARIDAPRLGDIDSKFLEDLEMDAPQLARFINRIDMHKSHFVSFRLRRCIGWSRAPNWATHYSFIVSITLAICSSSQRRRQSSLRTCNTTCRGQGFR